MSADAVGGVWSYALDLVAALNAEVLLAVLGPPPSPAQQEAARRIPRLRLHCRPSRLEWMEAPWADVDAAAEWLLGLARNWQPDLVHLNGYAHAATPWAAPTIVVGHSCVLSWWEAVHQRPAPPHWNEYRRRVARGLKQATAIVAPSLAMLQALERHYGAPCGRVIANGCDLARFHAAEKQELVLAAGRLWDAGKNIAALDKAAARLPWRVEIAGDQRHPESGGMPMRHAQPLGSLSPEALAEKMARAAIFAAPARYEPFGLAILEAAASRCALVLGDIPSLRELWNGAAVFVPPEDDDALAAAIRDLIAEPHRRERLTEAAGQRAQRFSSMRMTECYAALYDELLAAHSAAIGAGAA